MKLFSTILIILFMIHSILPTYYNKMINKNVIKSTPKKGIMLTFDDGPNPLYTPKLLDLLKQHQIKATFFVVTDHALQHPELVRRMQMEGHTIALHLLNHRNAWFYSYIYTKKDFSKSLEIMEEIGVKSHYYRPPWGHTNLFTYYFVKKHDLTMILWNLMVNDWDYNSMSLILQNKILNSINDSSILCLHDSGHGAYADPLAPKRMLEALKTTLPHLKQQGYHFVTPERSSL